MEYNTRGAYINVSDKIRRLRGEELKTSDPVAKKIIKIRSRR